MGNRVAQCPQASVALQEEMGRKKSVVVLSNLEKPR